MNLVNIVVAVFFLCTSIQASTVRLTTRVAIYKGERLQVNDGPKTKTIDRFSGIRYGQAPREELRFQRSRPAWKLEPGGDSKPELDATNYGHNCPQQPGFVEHMEMQTSEISEDCLFLNIWAPEDQKLRPVMVWLHGGSFISDSSVRTLYDGRYLAAIGDVVVVTVNYRLDTLGFLYSGPGKLNHTKSAEGNLALWDQALALEWIQDNIVYFNGDPERVTLAGHNAGATSVGLHLLSPISQGRLFQRALLMSGSIFSQLVVATSQASIEVSHNWLEKVEEKLECGKHRGHWTIEALTCLCKQPVDKLLKVLDPIGEKPFSPEVILGDDFLPFENLVEAVQRLFASKHSINVLIGSTDDEGGLVLPLLSSSVFSLLKPKELSQNEALQELANFAKKLIPSRGARFKQIDGLEAARYYINQRIGGQYSRAIGEAIGDFYVTCPLTEFARRLVRPNNSSSIYQYVWSEKFPPLPEMPCANWMGACHGTDVAMLFGLPFQSEGDFSPEARRSSRHFIRSISSFVHTGKPLAPGASHKEWPAYALDADTKRVVAPFFEFAAIGSNNRAFRRDWRRDVCADVWSKYLV